MAPRPHPDSIDRRPRLFILCGNMQEYQFWANRINRKTQEYNTIYAHDERVIRGYRNESYIRLGNWFTLRNHSAELMLEIMSHCDFKELHYSDIFDFESEEAEREFYERPEEFLSEEDMWV